MEELAVCLNGEKPVEEVSRIIQNRVINLVQENMQKKTGKNRSPKMWSGFSFWY